MANFSIQSSIQVIPIEEITFTDTSQKVKGIHSTIDKVFGSSIELPISVNANRVVGCTYNPTNNTGVSLSSALGLAEPVTIKFLFIKLTTRGNELTEGLGPRMTINFVGQLFQINFATVGNFFCCQSNNINDTDAVLIYGGTQYTSNAFEIVAGLGEEV